MKLLYLANARLPTEKAHGYQICKMCEAFSRSGADAILLHPRRDQPIDLSETDIFQYYGITPTFLVRELANWDVIRLYSVLPRRGFASIFFLHSVLWGLYASMVAKAVGADIYYTRDSVCAYWLTSLGLPTVYEAHTVPQQGQRWVLRRLAGRNSLRLLVAVTSFIKAELIKLGFKLDQMLICPDGVDLTLFKDLPPREECRRLLGLAIEKKIVGYIGRFQTMDMEKGIPELIRAMGCLIPAHSDVMLLCVGGPMDVVPSYLDLVEKMGVSENRIRFVDRVPNKQVPYWIRACDVVTIPWEWNEFSAYFTSPLKLFEYMAAGVPIVASDLPSLREVLCQGENSRLVPPGDFRHLARAIEELLRDPRQGEELAHQALEDVKEYDWNVRAQQILTRLQTQF